MSRCRRRSGSTASIFAECRVGRARHLRVAPALDDARAEDDRLELALAEHERRQVVSLPERVPHARLALDRHAAGHQVADVAVDRPLAHLERLGERARGDHATAAPSEPLDDLEEAVGATHGGCRVPTATRERSHPGEARRVTAGSRRPREWRMPDPSMTRRIWAVAALALVAALAAAGAWRAVRTGPAGIPATVATLPGAPPFPTEVAEQMMRAALAAQGRGLPSPHAPPRPRRRAAVHEPADPRDEPLPPPARPQPGELVSVGRRGLRAARAPRTSPVLPVRRLLDLPLVPRDGGGVVRGRGDRALPERALRRDQGRPRGAARRRRTST